MKIWWVLPVGFLLGCMRCVPVRFGRPGALSRMISGSPLCRVATLSSIRPAAGTLPRAAEVAIAAAAWTVAAVVARPHRAPGRVRPRAGYVVVLAAGTLSRDLAHGCPNWVDVTGPTHGPYFSNGPRTANAAWQRAVLARAGGHAAYRTEPAG